MVIAVALALTGGHVLAEDSDFPEWLGGTPDLDRKADRCAVYEWFFDEADRQTEGIASEDKLASMRLINLANKLVDHHLSEPSESYGVELDFLVIGRERGPFDFAFEMSRTELERLMNKGCGE